jgi:hypothetical protein
VCNRLRLEERTTLVAEANRKVEAAEQQRQAEAAERQRQAEAAVKEEPGQWRALTDRTLCGNALNNEKSGWDQTPRYGRMSRKHPAVALPLTPVVEFWGSGQPMPRQRARRGNLSNSRTCSRSEEVWKLILLVAMANRSPNYPVGSASKSVRNGRFATYLLTISPAEVVFYTHMLN